MSHHCKCKLFGRQAGFFSLFLLKNMKPAAKASVMGCIFRKWSWWEGLSKDIIYICREELKKNMDFGGCCDTHFLFLQNPVLAFDGHSDWYTRLFCINTEDAILFLLSILFNLITSAQMVSRWLLRGHYLKFMWIMDNVHFKQKVGEGVVPLQYLFCEVC